MDGLAVIMAQLVGGGGAAKVNIDKITDELSELGKRYPFQVGGVGGGQQRRGWGQIWAYGTPSGYRGTELRALPS